MKQKKNVTYTIALHFSTKDINAHFFLSTYFTICESDEQKHTTYKRSKTQTETRTVETKRNWALNRCKRVIMIIL